MKNFNVIKENLVFNFQMQSNNSKTGNMLQIFVLPLNWIIEGQMSDDSEICFDCVFSQSQTKKCYVRKGFMNLGLISKVKTLHKLYVNNQIPTYNAKVEKQILKYCKHRFIRFGAYGEPILLGEKLTSEICKNAIGWTGYTHQYLKAEYNWAKDYFMASVENDFQNEVAKKLGFRTFFVASNLTEILNKPNFINCPASKEKGKKIECIDCLLCMGTKTKTKKSIIINKH